MSALLPIFGTTHSKYWRNGIEVRERNSYGLIRVYLSQIILSFYGKEYYPIFQKMFHVLQLAFKLWDMEELKYQVEIVCPVCLDAKRPDLLNKYCVSLKECLDLISEQNADKIECRISKQYVSLAALVPELSIHTISHEDLEKESVPCGRGSHGTVFKGNYKGMLVAIKELSDEMDEQTWHDFIEEIQWLNYGQHPNVMDIIGISVAPPSIVLRFAAFGSLYDRLHKWKQNQNEDVWTAAWDGDLYTLRKLVTEGFHLDYQTKRWYYPNSVRKKKRFQMKMKC